MASSEGIIFANLFINDKEQFVDYFTRYYTENQAELDPVIQELQSVLTEYTQAAVNEAMAQKFKVAWNNFEQQVLLNTGDLELIVAYRDTSNENKGGLVSMSTIVPQSEVEGQGTNAKGAQSYGIQSGHALITESMKAVEAARLEEVLRQHIGGFLTQLDTTITKDEAHKIKQHHKDTLLEHYQEKYVHLTGTKWWEAFYGSGGYYFRGAGLGKAYDAFMNHMANKEKSFYDYLSSKGIQSLAIDKMRFKNTSVYEEEGGVHHKPPTSNFPELLQASRNNTGWYTGGDIIIVDPATMQVVYNIQLKTTTMANLTIFPERVSKIRTFLETFVDASPKDKAERLFDFMLTSVSNYDELNEAPNNTIRNIIDTSLQKNAKLQFTVFSS